MAKGSKTLHAARSKLLDLGDASRDVWEKSFGAKSAGESERTRPRSSVTRFETSGTAQTQAVPKAGENPDALEDRERPKTQQAPQCREAQTQTEFADLLDPQTAAAPLDAQSDQINDAARTAAPVVWLLGKVQSGKSSLVQALSGCGDAQIGEGFKACTTTARMFGFPGDAPMIRFLDTRGLGEATYDPAEDIAICAGQTQLLLVVLKALDPQQGAIVDVVRRLRFEHPHWPVLVAQTSLHHGYEPGQGHVLPYPYSGSDHGSDEGAGADVPGKSRNLDLDRALHYQRQLFDDIPGDGALRFVPLDFTLQQDGFEPRLYGLPALLDAIGDAAPAALAKMLKDAAIERNNRFSAAAHPHILGYASAAAAVDLVPVAGLIAVPGVQAKLLHALAGVYDAQWNRRLGVEFSAQLGAGIAMRLLAGLGVRELAKLVPGYGQTIGTAGAAATSFITTYALGRAACVFLAAKQTGVEDADGVARAYRDGLARALDLVKDRSFKAPSSSASSPPAAPFSPVSSGSPTSVSSSENGLEQTRASERKADSKADSANCDGDQQTERGER